MLVVDSSRPVFKALTLAESVSSSFRLDSFAVAYLAEINLINSSRFGLSYLLYTYCGHCEIACSAVFRGRQVFVSGFSASLRPRIIWMFRIRVALLCLIPVAIANLRLVALFRTDFCVLC